MASINFKKLKTAGDVKAMLRHCELEERLKHEHSNKDINKELTENNVNYTKLTYAQSCERYDKMIKFLDSQPGANLRKDRVSCFGLTVPACKDMSETEAKDFFLDVCRVFQNEFGAKNIVSAIAHFDEIHSYIDKGEVKESRPHLHFYVIPELNGKLNGKQFSSKKRMIELNQKIDAIAREKYHKRFMTNEKVRKRSVEELKSISNNEQEQRIKTRDELLHEIEDKSKSLEKTLMELRELETKRDSKEQAYMKYQEEPLTYPNEIKRKKPLFGKETIELDADEYDRFIEKVADCEDTLLYSKQRESSIYDIEKEAKQAILEANKALDEAQRVKHRTDLLDREVKHYKKCLEGVRMYALNHDDAKLCDFADRALNALEQSKVANKSIVKTVEHTFTSPSYDNDLER